MIRKKKRGISRRVWKIWNHRKTWTRTEKWILIRVMMDCLLKKRLPYKWTQEASKKDRKTRKIFNKNWLNDFLMILSTDEHQRRVFYYVQRKFLIIRSRHDALKMHFFCCSAARCIIQCSKNGAKNWKLHSNDVWWSEREAEKIVIMSHVHLLFVPAF